MSETGELSQQVHRSLCSRGSPYPRVHSHTT